ncbi:phosphoenolpyruvate--protein phosphotransferase [Alphaproteobacteria bacterium LMG 31809]|uniref:phosphoenolpyruvate--protein phosphotransferase n=2 Tax=Govanella unica TaxID=2975056 RepID=A0A9X3Z5X6_9PROT|nr:phosphoenolpyruvate--protein phosphotransferase [Govania unica]MDA5192349.1 phosphoenolpyruvate--protein phosphotransferase [Govania unica]
MASAVSADKRLDQVVRLIAGNMVSEVCSVYVARGGEVLELFATEGLKKEAIHKTRLRFREGLVGEIAATGAPLNLSNAQSHPKFVYRPETGEEIYHSLLGVPILRGGRVVGVLVVQNRTQRHYSDDEAEALQTVAMVIAELVSSNELVRPDEVTAATLERAATPSFEVMALAEGIAIGRAVFHEPIVEILEHVAQDSGVERDRLVTAFAALHQQIDNLMAAEDMKSGEHREILDVYKMFASDVGWRQRILEAVDSGLTAEAAVERVQVENRARLQSTPDPYLRERLSDLDDLSNRLIRHLMGRADTSASENLPDDFILLARSMGPADLLEYDRSKLRGVILQEGSHTSHVTIVARALGIPLVGQAGGIIERVASGEQLIIDGDEGWIYLSPSAEIIQSYQETLVARTERFARYTALRNEPAVTLDGVEIELYMNAGLAIDLPHLESTGAKGIGLFRTEFQFMVGAQMPRLETQIEHYSEVLDAAGDRPVVFRTLDIGGDKPVAFMVPEDEENPALGWRAIRVALDRPALLRYQLRALIQAATGRAISIMFPMITELAEFKAARAIVDKELERRRKLGLEGPASIRIGTMIEVPALAWHLEPLLKHVDFVSIGSNDLLQFFFAADRGNAKVSGRYDVLSPAALSFLHHIISTCDRHNVPVTFCGELAGKTLEAMALVGLGLRRLSISPAGIGPVKTMVRSLKLAPLEAYLKDLMPLGERSVRSRLMAFAHDHGVIL